MNGSSWPVCGVSWASLRSVTSVQASDPTARRSMRKTFSLVDWSRIRTWISCAPLLISHATGAAGAVPRTAGGAGWPKDMA